MLAIDYVIWLIRKSIVPLLGGLIAICVLLYHYQEKLIFLPNAVEGYSTPDKNPEGLRSPEDFRIPYESIAIASTDGVALHAWFIKCEDHLNAPTIFFFQGNAGNMGFRLPNLAALVKAVKVNVVATSYRGYGWSTGVPSEKGLIDDSRAALKYFTDPSRALIDRSKIFIFGRSLGGAVSLRLAADFPDQVRGVMVENTFYSMKSVVLHLMPPFRAVPHLLGALLRVRFESNLAVTKMNTPSLFISGTDDTLVPPSQLRALFDDAKSPFKWLLVVRGGAHNDTWQRYPSEYYRTIGEFIAACLQSPGADEQVITLPKEGPVKSTGAARGPKYYETVLRKIGEFEAPPVCEAPQETPN